MKEDLKISIMGDVCPDRQFNRFFKNTENIDFGDISDYIKNSDITLANLEAPATSGGKPINKTGPCLHCKIEDLSSLKDLGIDYLSLANNHILDYGRDALLETINEAGNAGIAVFGAGENTSEARKPLVIEKNGWKIGLISFAEEEFSISTDKLPGANLFDPYISFNDIEVLKSKCDYLIVLYHGGIEHYELPSPLLQKKCRKMVEYGADLVLCQHSHCIGTFEEYQNATILYGQGNSFFGMIPGNNKWNEGFLIEVILENEKKQVNFKLIEAREKGIEFSSQEKSDLRFEQMIDLSKKLNDDYIKEQWLDYCKTQEAMDLPLLYGWGRILNKLNRILNNKIANRLLTKKKRMISMNLMRCDAHREVVQTILENSYM